MNVRVWIVGKSKHISNRKSFQAKIGQNKMVFCTHFRWRQSKISVDSFVLVKKELLLVL